MTDSEPSRTSHNIGDSHATYYDDLPPCDLISTTGKALILCKAIGATSDQNYAYRYTKIAEGSTAGHSCKYAMASHKLWIKSKQREATIELLRELKLLIDSALDEVEVQGT